MLFYWFYLSNAFDLHIKICINVITIPSTKLPVC